MGLYDQFPYRNFHELNADWLIKQANERKAKIEDSSNSWKTSRMTITSFYGWPQHLTFQDLM